MPPGCAPVDGSRRAPVRTARMHRVRIQHRVRVHAEMQAGPAPETGSRGRAAGNGPTECGPIDEA